MNRGRRVGRRGRPPQPRCDAPSAQEARSALFPQKDSACTGVIRLGRHLASCCVSRRLPGCAPGGSQPEGRRGPAEPRFWLACWSPRFAVRNCLLRGTEKFHIIPLRTSQSNTLMAWEGELGVQSALRHGKGERRRRRRVAPRKNRLVCPFAFFHGKFPKQRLSKSDSSTPSKK